MKTASRKSSNKLGAIVAPVILLLSASAAQAQTFTWPISGTSTPDVMNTSFGPRIEVNAWDFHDGMDLPASCDLTTNNQTANDTVVKAVADGTITKAGPAGTDGMSSRHVFLELNDASGRPLRVLYLHLKKIDAAYDPAMGAVLPKAVTRGTALGLVGKDGAETCHLHLEFRRDNLNQIGSIHPLHYLPYTDTNNWVAPVQTTARFNGALATGMAARLFFTAPSKLEGDLIKVEVDMLDANAAVIATRKVDFDDKTTVTEGSDDDTQMFVNDIAVEGYQAPDMIGDGRSDLHEGVTVRNLPSNTAALVARIYDIGGHIVTSAPITVPTSQQATTVVPNLSGTPFPPANFTTIVASSGSVSASNGTLTALDSITSGSVQRAAIETLLPAGRFQWNAQMTVTPSAMSFPQSGNSAQLIYFGTDVAGSGNTLAVSGRIRGAQSGNAGGLPVGTPVAGLTALESTGTTRGKDLQVALTSGSAAQWEIRISRLGTREATAVLLFAGVEQMRMDWDSTNAEPRRFRVGLGYSSPASTTSLAISNVSVADATP